MALPSAAIKIAFRYNEILRSYLIHRQSVQDRNHSIVYDMCRWMLRLTLIVIYFGRREGGLDAV